MDIIIVLFFTFIFLTLLNLFGKVWGCLIFKKTSKINNIVLGFLYISFLNFLVAFPSQLFHLSWFVYYIIFSILLFLSILFSIIYVSRHKLFSKINMREHFKNYWFLYALVILHTVINYASNLHIYIAAHGDDGYYLARIVKNIGSESLLSNSPFVAKELLEVKESFLRQVETFELFYSYIASFLKVSPVYFVRFLISPSLLVICYMSYYSLVNFLNPHLAKKNMQYFLLPVFFFCLIGVAFIPKGGNPFFISYLENGAANYEAWKWNFTLYYGSTIVMMIGAPLYIMMYYLTLIKQKNYWSFYCGTILLTIVLLSYSLQAVIIAAFIYFLFCGYLLMNKMNVKDYIIHLGNILVIACGIIILYILQVDNFSFMNMIEENVQNWNAITFPSMIKQIFHNGIFFWLTLLMAGLIIYKWKALKKLEGKVFLFFAIFGYFLILFPITGFLLQWMGVYTFIFGRMYNSIIILYVFSLFFFLCQLYIKEKYYRVIAIVLLSLSIILIPVSRSKAATEYVTGYGLSRSALNNKIKVHSVVNKINDSIIKDIQTSSFSSKPTAFIPTAIVAKNNRTLLLSYHEQFLISDNFIEYNSLLLVEHFGGTLPDKYDENSVFAEFRQNIMHANAPLLDEMILQMQQDYQLNYFVTYKSKQIDSDLVEVVAEITDVDLDYTLCVYKIK